VTNGGVDGTANLYRRAVEAEGLDREPTALGLGGLQKWIVSCDEVKVAKPDMRLVSLKA
jgi:hypothetical protein